METVSIHTTQNISIDFKLAGLIDRIFAFLIDSLVILAYYIIALSLGFSMFGGSMAYFVVNGIIIYLYFLLSEVFMDGQTVGKRAMNIKVVKLDGSKPGLGAFILRWVMIPIDFSISGAIAMVLIIFTKNSQRLGDLLAGTTVVKLKDTRNTLQQKRAIFNAIQEDYEPSFPEAIRLSSTELKLIEQSIEAFRKNGQRRPVQVLKERVEQKLNIQSDLPPIKFLHTLRKDHHYYASR